LAVDVRVTSTTQDSDKLTTKIVVQPAIEDRVGACGAEGNEVAHGKDEGTV